MQSDDEFVVPAPRESPGGQSGEPLKQRRTRRRSRPWTMAEQEVLVKEHLKFGNAWASIRVALPGRSTTEIKNAWYSSLRCKQPGIRTLLRAYVRAVTQLGEDVVAREKAYKLAFDSVKRHPSSRQAAAAAEWDGADEEGEEEEEEEVQEEDAPAGPGSLTVFDAAAAEQQGALLGRMQPSSNPQQQRSLPSRSSSLRKVQQPSKGPSSARAVGPHSAPHWPDSKAGTGLLTCAGAPALSQLSHDGPLSGPSSANTELQLSAAMVSRFLTHGRDIGGSSVEHHFDLSGLGAPTEPAEAAYGDQLSERPVGRSIGMRPGSSAGPFARLSTGQGPNSTGHTVQGPGSRAPSSVGPGSLGPNSLTGPEAAAIGAVLKADPNLMLQGWWYDEATGQITGAARADDVKMALLASLSSGQPPQAVASAGGPNSGTPAGTAATTLPTSASQSLQPPKQRLKQMHREQAQSAPVQQTPLPLALQQQLRLHADEPGQAQHRPRNGGALSCGRWDGGAAAPLDSWPGPDGPLGHLGQEHGPGGPGGQLLPFDRASCGTRGPSACGPNSGSASVGGPGGGDGGGMGAAHAPGAAEDCYMAPVGEEAHNGARRPQRSLAGQEEDESETAEVAAFLAEQRRQRLLSEAAQQQQAMRAARLGPHPSLGLDLSLARPEDPMGLLPLHMLPHGHFDADEDQDMDSGPKATRMLDHPSLAWGAKRVSAPRGSSNGGPSSAGLGPAHAGPDALHPPSRSLDGRRGLALGTGAASAAALAAAAGGPRSHDGRMSTAQGLSLDGREARGVQSLGAAGFAAGGGGMGPMGGHGPHSHGALHGNGQQQLLADEAELATAGRQALADLAAMHGARLMRGLQGAQQSQLLQHLQQHLQQRGGGPGGEGEGGEVGFGRRPRGNTHGEDSGPGSSGSMVSAQGAYYANGGLNDGMSGGLKSGQQWGPEGSLRTGVQPHGRVHPQAAGVDPGVAVRGATGQPAQRSGRPGSPLVKLHVGGGARHQQRGLGSLDGGVASLQDREMVDVALSANRLTALLLQQELVQQQLDELKQQQHLTELKQQHQALLRQEQMREDQARQQQQAAALSAATLPARLAALDFSRGSHDRRADMLRSLSDQPEPRGW